MQWSSIIECCIKDDKNEELPHHALLPSCPMSRSVAGLPGTREAFDKALHELRPQLHRYCARMTGSVVDGEDVVQEALVKAIEAFSQSGSIADPEAWLFRIAHNAALDFLRLRAWHHAAHADKDLEMIVDPVTP